MQWNEYKKKIIRSIEDFSFDEEILHVIYNSKKNNQKIFIAGNGGSAALANHYLCDFSKGAIKNWKDNHDRFQVLSLSANYSYITAIANDESYEEIFKQQLINLANKNDILILISSSGNSPNIIKAVEYAKDIGMITIGITGLQGGKLHELADYKAHITTDMYEIAEDMHAIFGHFLAVFLREKNEIISKNLN